MSVPIKSVRKCYSSFRFPSVELTSKNINYFHYSLYRCNHENTMQGETNWVGICCERNNGANNVHLFTLKVSPERI